MTEDRDVPERLRRALTSKAETIHPEPRLDRIEEQLMARTQLTDAQRWTIAGVAAVATLLVVALFVVSADGDEGDADLATGTSTTTTTEASEETTTTSAAPTETTTTTTTTPSVDPFAVAFPAPDDSRRFDAPAAAARAFATEVLGFTELVLGGATSTGERTAIVPVQQREGGPDTVVSLEQLEDDAWYALGASTEDITIDSPAPGTSLASPFQTTGQALAFEGTVRVVVLAQGDPAPLGEGFVTGSGSPPAGPYDGKIEFRPPTEPVPGIVVYTIHSEEDGQVSQAAAVLVRLTPFTS